MSLKDRVVIMTGAGRGIGKAAALKFAEAGASVAAVSRTKAQLDDIVKQIKAKGGKAIAVEADISVEAQVKAMVDAVVKQFGKVDVMVNNAAMPGPTKPLYEIDMKEWEIPIAINLRGSAMCAKYVLPHMIKQRSGVIINVSSSAGRQGIFGRTHYCASKAGLFGLTMALATEVGKYNIRVNCVVPGAINTELLVAYHQRIANERGVSYETVRDEAAKAAPLNKIVSPAEVADFMVYLASDQSSGLTGQNININAGSYMT
ncbi:MAG: SDR family oxidoreductase [Chloroflexi bacterium]|nr:SDR family oxidoreductase [Chloroflexota bacterium]